MLAALSLGKWPIKEPILKSLKLFYPLAWARKRTCTALKADLLWKHQICYLQERTSAFFSAEILQAVAVKGLKSHQDLFRAQLQDSTVGCTDSVVVTLLGTAVDRASCGEHKLFRTCEVPTSLAFIQSLRVGVLWDELLPAFPVPSRPYDGLWSMWTLNPNKQTVLAVIVVVVVGRMFLTTELSVGSFDTFFLSKIPLNDWILF